MNGPITVPRRRKIGHRGFPKNDGAGLFDFGNDRRILVRYITFKSDRTKTRLYSSCLGLVLDRNRDTVKRSHEFSTLRESSIELLSLCQRVGIKYYERVERRTLFIVSRDPVEIALGYSATIEGVSPKCIVYLADRSFFQNKPHPLSPMSNLRRSRNACRPNGRYSFPVI